MYVYFGTYKLTTIGLCAVTGVDLQGARAAAGEVTTLDNSS